MTDREHEIEVWEREVKRCSKTFDRGRPAFKGKYIALVRIDFARRKLAEVACLNPDYCGTGDADTLCANCLKLAEAREGSREPYRLHLRRSNPGSWPMKYHQKEPMQNEQQLKKIVEESLKTLRRISEQELRKSQRRDQDADSLPVRRDA